MHEYIEITNDYIRGKLAIEMVELCRKMKRWLIMDIIIE